MKASFFENIVRLSAKRASYAHRTRPTDYVFTLDSGRHSLSFSATGSPHHQSLFAVDYSTTDMSGTKGSCIVWVKTDLPEG